MNAQPVVNPQGLAIIRRAMDRRKKMVETAFAQYETTKIWSHFRQSFLSHNSQINLKYLVDLAACDLADPQQSYFVPGSKKGQIVICYNKVKDLTHFNQLLTYNVQQQVMQMVFAYDNIMDSHANWNDHRFVTGSTIRALNLSETCKNANKSCFRQEIDRRVNAAQRFTGRDCFEEVYDRVINDVRPINEMKFA